LEAVLSGGARQEEELELDMAEHLGAELDAVEANARQG
jgi:hypothetical protein